MALTHAVVFSALPDEAWLAWSACGLDHKYLVKSPTDIMKQLRANGRQYLQSAWAVCSLQEGRAGDVPYNTAKSKI